MAKKKKRKKRATIRVVKRKKTVKRKKKKKKKKPISYPPQITLATDKNNSYYNVNKEYTKEYYGKRMDFKNKVYSAMGKIFEDILKPRNVIDVGCGHGILMDGFSCPCVGIEASDEGVRQAKERGYRTYQHDLRFPISLGRIFDVAISIEVAEHLEEKYANIFIDNLISLSDRILITASPQKEKYHYNPQPKNYWVKRFEAKKFLLNKTTNIIVDRMKREIPPVRDYLYKNLMYFEKY